MPRPVKRRSSVRQDSQRDSGQDSGVDSGEDTGMDTERPASLFDNMGDDDYVMVWRKHDVDKSPVFLCKLTESETTEENLIDRYGGGEYVLREKRRGSTGTFVWGRQRTIRLAGAFKDPAKQLTASVASERDSDAKVPGMTGGVTKDDVQIAGMLQMFQMQQSMAAQQAQTSSQMQQMMIAQMEAQRTAMMALVEMTAKMQGQKENPVEMFKAAVELVKGTAPVPSPKSDIKELMEGMQSILAFRDDLMPSPATGNPLMDSVPKVLDLVQQGFEMKRLEAAGGKPTVPTVKTNAEVPTPALEAGMPLWQKVLTAQKRQLLGAASSGKDPQVAALAAVEFMPEGIRGAMEEFARRDDMLTQAFAVIPELQEFPHWAEAFFAEARVQLLGDGTEDAPESDGDESGEGEEGTDGD